MSLRGRCPKQSPIICGTGSSNRVTHLKGDCFVAIVSRNDMLLLRLLLCELLRLCDEIIGALHNTF